MTGKGRACDWGRCCDLADAVAHPITAVSPIRLMQQGA